MKSTKSESKNAIRVASSKSSSHRPTTDWVCAGVGEMEASARVGAVVGVAVVVAAGVTVTPTTAGVRANSAATVACRSFTSRVDAPLEPPQAASNTSAGAHTRRTTKRTAGTPDAWSPHDRAVAEPCQQG